MEGDAAPKPRRTVPVVPNAAVVRGRLTRIRSETDTAGTTWDVVVEAADDADNLPNFARAYVGKAIEVVVRPDTSPDLAEGDALEARVAFRGDERGGRFILIQDDARKL